MPQIENNQLVIVTGTLAAGAQSITVDLSKVNFNPDEMVVKQLSFVEFGSLTTSTFSITCDFTNSVIAVGSTSGIADTGFDINVENRIKLNGVSVHGLRTFNVNLGANFAAAPNVQGIMMMLIEFVKYKPKKY